MNRQASSYSAVADWPFENSFLCTSNHYIRRRRAIPEFQSTRGVLVPEQFCDCGQSRSLTLCFFCLDLGCTGSITTVTRIDCYSLIIYFRNDFLAKLNFRNRRVRLWYFHREFDPSFRGYNFCRSVWNFLPFDDRDHGRSEHIWRFKGAVHTGVVFSRK